MRLAVRRTLRRALRTKPQAHWVVSPRKPRILPTILPKVLRMPLMTFKRKRVMLPMMLRKRQAMSLMTLRALSTTSKKAPRTESLQMLRAPWMKLKKVSKMTSLQMRRAPWMKLKKVSKMTSLQMRRMLSTVFKMMSTVFKMMSRAQRKIWRTRLAMPSMMSKTRQVSLLMMLRMV